MDRFSQLEFDELHPKPSRKSGEPVRDADYFYKEALKYWLARDFELALRNYSRMLETDSTTFTGWSGQVQMLIELGEYREAIIWADKALESFPEHPELLAFKAVAYARDAKWPQAIAYSDNSISKNDVTARVWLARAEVMLDRKTSIADNCISKAIGAAGEKSVLIKFEAARLLRKKKSYSAAIGLLHEVTSLIPKAPLVWYELGCCQVALGLPQARASLEESIRLHPDWPPPKEMLRKFNKRGFFHRLFGR